MFWNLILNYSKNAIAWITDPKNRTVLLFILLCAGALFIFHQNNKINELETQQQTYSSNISALTDSVREYRLDNGDLVAEKGALQTSISDLRNINTDLYDELQEEKNKPPKTITKIEYVVKRDTFYVDDSRYTYLGDDSYRISWEYQESGGWGLRALEGNSRFDFIGDSTITNINTQITKDIFEMNITTGFRETEDGKLQAYARTSAPNVSFTQVDGAIIDPNAYVNQSPNKWGVGFHVGYGLTSEFKPTPYIGVGLSYDVFSF